jgi:hypothetical protein
MEKQSEYKTVKTPYSFKEKLIVRWWKDEKNRRIKADAGNKSIHCP